MRNEELQAIRTRVEATTPGPWVEGDDVETAGEIYAGDPRVPILHGPPFEGPREEDLQFIAHARTDVPALLAEVERLREMIRDSGILDQLRTMGPQGRRQTTMAEDIAAMIEDPGRGRPGS